MCENRSTCQDGINGYTCSCLFGFSGVFCEVSDFVPALLMVQQTLGGVNQMDDDFTEDVREAIMDQFDVEDSQVFIFAAKKIYFFCTKINTSA